jgi:hypothetical protein
MRATGGKHGNARQYSERQRATAIMAERPNGHELACYLNDESLAPQLNVIVAIRLRCHDHKMQSVF